MTKKERIAREELERNVSQKEGRMDYMRSILANMMLTRLTPKSLRLVWVFAKALAEEEPGCDTLEPATEAVIGYMQTMTAQEQAIVLDAARSIKAHLTAPAQP